MKRPIFFFFALIFTFSCKSQPKSLFKISPEIFTDNMISLSDIADDISYVPLDNYFPIGLTYKLVVTTKNIYLSIKDVDVGILKFDNQGKLVCKIGNRGRGPEEYIYGMEFSVDEKTGNIYVLDRSTIKVYSFSGRFIRNINYNDYLSYQGGDIEIYNSLIFIPDFIQYGNAKYNWIFLDTLGNLVSRKENSVPPFTVNSVIPGQIYKFNNNLYYFNYLNDTIFSIKPDLKCSPAYLFAKGDFRFPNNFVFDFTKLNDIFRPGEMFETKQYIFLNYSYKGKSAISLINKKTKKVSQAYKNIENTTMPVKTKALIENDLDAGLPFSTKPIFSNYTKDGTEYLATFITPYDLKTYLLTNDFKSKIPVFPEKKKQLEKIAGNLNDTDNPVLMIIRIKKMSNR